MSLCSDVVENLIKECFEAKERSYSPYSNFRVGAALLCADGTIIKGCNVENASFGLTICAERTAFCTAIAAGHRKFQAIAISSDLANRHIVPCGMCRQTMVEFSADLDVYMTKPDGSYTLTTSSKLLPDSFTPSQLEEDKIISNNNTHF